MELFRFIIIELLSLLKTFRRQNIALKMRKIVKKKVLKCCPKSKKNAKIPLRVRVEYVAISVFFGNAWKIF